MKAEFYDRPVVEVARDLVGCTISYENCAGVIVETEAYHMDEPACHAFVGYTERTSVLFGEPGTAYVYRSYGVHALLNAVCEPAGVGTAVLIRAVEPLEGIDEMRARRGWDDIENLCSGPGKLTQAFGFGLDCNGTSLIDGPVRFGERLSEPEDILVGTRIGITRAVELPWRFTAVSRHVSRPWPPGLRDALRAVA